MMAGTFVVRGAEVLDAEVADSSASEPDLDRLAEVARAAA
jgi:hypothetical protein